MKWEKVKLGEITESCLGKMLDQNKNKGTYQKYLANVNVRWGSFDLENLSEMRFEDDEAERYGVRYGDLIVCEGGEPGRCAIWKNEIPNMKIQKALHRVRVLPEKADAFYLLYWFIYAGQKKALDQYFTGATIKHMPGDKLKQVVVDLPDLPTQHRIAAILSAYDDLIENNRRQIKLLEEAAQRLYREWFVELRFPGCEDVKIVDGVPEGWSIVKLQDILTVHYGKDHRRIANGNIPVYGSGGYMRGCGRPLYTGQSVLIPRKGTLNNIMYVDESFWTVDTMFYTEMKLSHIAYYVFQFIKALDFYAMNTGAAVPSTTSETINNLVLMLPSVSILEQFDVMVQQYAQKMMCLVKQNNKLSTARDLLLPELMNGGREI